MTPLSSNLKKLGVAALLVPPWLMFVVSVYWLFFDNADRIEVVYEHPRFLSAPAHNRTEAAALAVDVVKSHTSLYIYREICVRSPVIGTVKAVWESNTFVWAAPERPIPEFATGCFVESFNVVAPSSSPSRDFVYKASWWIEQNPLVVRRTDLTTLPLRILAPTQDTDMVRR